ncbi:type IV pilus secretin PilQ [Comamonas sp. J-3]|uniref:type IV pilus secretin PilQ n=1 Tax=Comamonas trifloxystrobinivorans TaxID=3350256 RepID=UPI0037296855
MKKFTLLIPLAACLLPALAMAQGKINKVSTLVRDGMELVKIETEGAPLVLPETFSIQSPARVVLDLPGFKSALPNNRMELNQGNLRSVNVVETDTKARLVLNLKESTTYKTEVSGQDLLIAIQPAVKPVAVNQQDQQFAADGNAYSQPLSDVDFRRGSDGAGRLIIALPNNKVGVNITKRSDGLTLELQHTTLPEGLRRKLDVGDFGTPVRLISSRQAGGTSFVDLSNTGEWEHSAYQSDNQFVVEVRQRKSDPNKLGSGGSFTGEKLSLSFQNIEVRSLLQVIADFTNFNIVTSDTVNGSLTLRLKDVPWDQALQIILDSKGLGMRKAGTVLWIAPKDEIDERIQKDFDAVAKLEEKMPVQTQAFQLNYAKATELLKQITTVPSNSGGGGGNNMQNRFLTPRGSAMAEPRTNQLFVTDIPQKLEEFRRLLVTLDVPVRQVLIEARIVEASDTFGRSLGVRLGGGDLRAVKGGDGGYSIGGGNRVGFGTSYSNAVGTTGLGGSVDVGGNFVNLPAASLGSGLNNGTFALSIFNSAANRFLSLELSALEADGKGKVVSSPRLITADQTKALIEQGTEIPYQNSAQNGATTVEFKKAVLKLEVTPQITPEGNIIMDLDIAKDSKGEETTGGPAIDTKHVKTQVLVENGGTVVIGGIFELIESENINKIPLLGDIPVMGNLFKNKKRTSEKKEMLVFITPKMISDRGELR